MCGIAGIATWRSEPVSRGELLRMTNAIEHRGPDDSGSWFEDNFGIALGHRRLSIIDLSPQGHQPMASHSGRYTIAYNGEIYNFESLRSDLEKAGKAPIWRGHSDTEVLLAAFDAWGMDVALTRIEGMFAMAVWDHRNQSLSFARDRIGEKPLYYGNIGGRILFASELKAITAIAKSELTIDRKSLARFMQHGYVPAPASIYHNIKKLPAGNLLTLTTPADFEKEPFAYWSLRNDDVAQLREQYAKMQVQDCINSVHDIVFGAVSRQMTSDVPIGAFLSGGVDSSLVVSMMAAQNRGRVKTFTIGFDDPKFNEAVFAKEVAKHLGTEHTELYVTAADALAVVPDLPQMYDEPFADSSQIPTFLVSQMTRQHVTVSLSGDGGDELFAGYPRYWLSEKLKRRLEKVPAFVRRPVASALGWPSPGTWDKVIAPVLNERRLQDINGRRIHRLAQLANTASIEDLYVRLTSHWQPEDELVQGLDQPLPLWENWADGTSTDIESMRMRDIGHYLPDDLLVKVDRASMRVSLESRAPFLSHKVVEAAMAMPEQMLVRDGVGKWVLRQMLDRYVPRQLIERPKAGFAVPLGDWLRGPLKAWAGDLLAPDSLRSQDYIDPRKVEKIWAEHLSGNFDRSSYLWNILMFQAWVK
ncbi:asparagine synthase (glutamine-hydrolyzing) [Sphingorhabdus contaminans]|uniref:asparagine synthase (glutamine-hydrolyzing) n=1 Tax=Sphingorhabdus contaminans TaxID=1343899 RepID=UPI003D2A6DEB